MILISVYRSQEQGKNHFIVPRHPLSTLYRYRSVTVLFGCLGKASWDLGILGARAWLLALLRPTLDVLGALAFRLNFTL